MEINLLQEEVSKLREIKERNDRLVISFGEVAIQKARLELLQQALTEELKDISSKEQGISDELVTKYGPISINLEKGTALKMSQ